MILKRGLHIVLHQNQNWDQLIAKAPIDFLSLPYTNYFSAMEIFFLQQK